MTTNNQSVGSFEANLRQSNFKWWFGEFLHKGNYEGEGNPKMSSCAGLKKDLQLEKLDKWAVMVD